MSTVHHRVRFSPPGFFGAGQAATLLALTVQLAGCLAPPIAMTSSPQLLAPQDSLTRAFDTGRHDALQLYRGSTWVHVATPLILPLGLVLARTTSNPKTMAGLMFGTNAGVMVGGTLWTYRETHRPVPEPPDSMRLRYGLSDSLWHGYRQGFQSGIDARRQTDLANSSRMTVMGLAIFGSLYFTIVSHR